MLRTRLVRPDGDLRWALTALSLLALLATFALPVLGPGLAAYAPAHGHLTLAGYLPPNHVHPWDIEAGSPASNSSTDEAGEEFVFTLANDGDAASGWASATLTPNPLTITGISLSLESDAISEHPPAAPAMAAPSPPPRILT